MLPERANAFVTAGLHRFSPANTQYYGSYSSWTPLLFRRAPITRVHNDNRRRIAHAVPTRAKAKTITFIGGGGKMATAIIQGLQRSQTSFKITAVSPRIASLDHLDLPSTRKKTDNLSATHDADIIFLCVKPNKLPIILSEISAVVSGPTPPTLVSVVAGYSIARIQSLVNNTNVPVIRAMPNTAAAVNFSATCLCCSDSTSSAQFSEAEHIFATIGTVAAIAENDFAAFTALSGSAVAFLFMFIETLADAAVRHGISRPMALRVAAQVVAGSGLLAGAEGAPHPAQLRNAVESPGGCTVAGTSVLEKAGLRAALHAATDAVIDRLDEMGE